MRFTVIPVLLFGAMLSSSWVLISCSVLVTWWDVYHSSLQTFGIGRIYDMKRGNHPEIGRRLDYLVNLLLYAGPVLAGATLMDHVEDFEEFSEVGSVFFTSIPAYVESQRSYLTWGVLLLGVPFLAYYLYAYWRLHQNGYQISFQKVFLLVSTAVCSIWAWGFNTFGEAFFIMNFFHALQYFALVWTKEKKTMARLFGLPTSPRGKQMTLVLYLTLALSFGFWMEIKEVTNDVLFSVFILISLLHFWYDGFIWSVRKKQV